MKTTLFRAVHVQAPAGLEALILFCILRKTCPSWPLMSAETATTPMMKQYLAMRRDLPADVLLLFRLGDFYEMFFEDAKTGAGILNVALTKRNGIPMCGVPHHAAQGY